MDKLIDLVVDNWWVILAWGWLFTELFDMDKIMKKIKGFTLIELMIVVAIIGILASVMIPAIQGAKEPEPAVIEQQSNRELFEENVDSDCVKRYGKHACEYQGG